MNGMSERLTREVSAVTFACVSELFHEFCLLCFFGCFCSFDVLIHESDECLVDFIGSYHFQNRGFLVFSSQQSPEALNGVAAVLHCLVDDLDGLLNYSM